ncbi:hypothetical protein RMSM_00351 [Rhodopirellula maiorica SM1]|uniref:Uncharacterized protein n=1 Tax=Rhodopirellula maiorica SM1 TaxID=1265738 RepID=M5RTU7_9BACT|nr:hypothetical protein RMSM_00351 [Rhodopirellula maiorica SM1]
MLLHLIVQEDEVTTEGCTKMAKSQMYPKFDSLSQWQWTFHRLRY